MSDATQTSFIHRLRHTPLRDLFRCRLSGRLDWRARLAAAELPVPARELIGRIVKRTRLWRIEKAAVADELAAHFRDAIAEGQAVEGVIAEFGNERKAARLVRRAKIRNRPMVWHVWRWAVRGVVALIVIYAALLLPFFLGRPTPTVDYLAEINRPILSAAPAELGWPLYRRAILGMFRTPTGDPAQPYKASIPKWWQIENVDGPNWPEAAAWLPKHSADIELLRQATAKPMMGYLLAPGPSTSDPLLYPHIPCSNERSIGQPALFMALLPYLSESRNLARILMVDAKAAQLDHDNVRLERDVDAILDLSGQIRRPNEFLVTYLLGISIDHFAMQALHRAIAVEPTILSDEQLIRLAHKISQPKTDADLVSFGGEKMALEDMVQRIYTDDGHGDGHITAQGLHFLQLALNDFGDGKESDRDRLLIDLAGPGILLTSASRKQMQEMSDRIIDQAQSQLALPMRDVDVRATDRAVYALKKSPVDRLRYGILLDFFPALTLAQAQAEKDLGSRDGMATAIALELYHRRLGRYPDQLADLVPQFLPAIPADRITGEPIKYRLKNGEPLLYSVGVDRIDDGGTPAVIRDGRPAESYAAQWDRDPDEKPIHGDWILYPPWTPRD